MRLTSEIHVLYNFGPYVLDTAKRLLTKEGRRVSLGPKTYDLLLLFVESHGRVLARTELGDALWPNTFVEESNLTFQISALRKAMANDGIEWIETVPKYGYRFVGAVTELSAQPTASQNVVASLPQSSSTFERSEPAKDLPVRVEDVHTESGPVVVPRFDHAKRLRFSGGYVLAALAMVAAATIALVHFREPAPTDRTIRFLVEAPEKTSFASPAISPDGKWLALIGIAKDGERRVWIRPVDSLRAEPLAGTEFVEAMFWSPDNRSIGFFANGKLKSIGLRGPASTVCDAPGGGGAGSWSSKSGAILFQTRARPELYRVPASGGIPQKVTTLDSLRQDTGHYAPQFLPDGHHFIFYVKSLQAERSGIYAGSLDSKETKYLLSASGNAIYAKSPGGEGYLLFTAGTALMGRAFDSTRLRLTGDPFPVAQQPLVTLASGLNRGSFSASLNGILAYQSGSESPKSELVWVDRHGQRIGVVGEPADYSNPALSPDEKKLAVSLEDSLSGTRDIWIFNLERGTSSRVTFDSTDETDAVWSPDSTQIAYSASVKGVFDIYHKLVTDTSNPEPILESNEDKFVQGWSRDGRFVLFTTTVGGIWTVSIDGSHRLEMPLAQKSRKSPMLEFSPDGQWIAYQQDGPIRPEVYIERLGRPGGEWQVSSAGGAEPHWSRDGKELYYIAEDKLMAVEVQSQAAGIEAASQKVLFDVNLDTALRRNHYQVAANGQKFLIDSRLNPPSPVTVVVNWKAEAK